MTRRAPDGSRIAFDSDRTDPDLNDGAVINDVFTMRPDGSDVRQLTDSKGFSGDAAYSPDGSLIAFDADRGVTSGSPGWPSTPPSGSSDTEPRFTPDGRRLVFSRFQGGHLPESSGSRIVFETNPKSFQLDGWYDLVWSPDGTKILAGHELNADGSDLHWVSPNVDGEHQPDWGTAPPG